MRIVDLGLSNDAIDAADGSGSAKVEKQATWAIRNTPVPPTHSIVS